MEDALFNLSRATASMRSAKERLERSAGRTRTVMPLISAPRKKRCVALEGELQELVANEVDLRRAELDSLFVEVVQSIRKLSRDKRQLEVNIRRKSLDLRQELGRLTEAEQGAHKSKLEALDEAERAVESRISEVTAETMDADQERTSTIASAEALETAALLEGRSTLSDDTGDEVSLDQSTAFRALAACAQLVATRESHLAAATLSAQKLVTDLESADAELKAAKSQLLAAYSSKQLEDEEKEGAEGAEDNACIRSAAEVAAREAKEEAEHQMRELVHTKRALEATSKQVELLETASRAHPNESVSVSELREEKFSERDAAEQSLSDARAALALAETTARDLAQKIVVLSQKTHTAAAAAAKGRAVATAGEGAVGTPPVAPARHPSPLEVGECVRAALQMLHSTTAVAKGNVGDEIDESKQKEGKPGAADPLGTTATLYLIELGVIRRRPLEPEEEEGEGGGVVQLEWAF